MGEEILQRSNDWRLLGYNVSPLSSPWEKLVFLLSKIIRLLRFFICFYTSIFPFYCFVKSI